MIFKDTYFFLSTFYSEQKIKLTINNEELSFSNAEAAFQAQKDPSKAKYFQLLRPLEAKNYAKDYVKGTDSWETRQIAAMGTVMYLKFSDTYLFNKLSKIKGEIVNENYWKDDFWGVYKGKGKNILGKILMCIRDTNNNLAALANLIAELQDNLK